MQYNTNAGIMVARTLAESHSAPGVVYTKYIAVAIHTSASEYAIKYMNSPMNVIMTLLRLALVLSI